MIIIVGAITLTAEGRERGITIGCEHSARLRDEPGCISHNCYVDAENENRLHFFEQWADGAAVDAHFKVPETNAFLAEISQLGATAPEIAMFNAEAIEAPAL